METRANHLWVGAVTLLLLGLLAAFIIWLAQLGQSERKEYDILFGQEVSGLATGSVVSFAGVPVGQVSEIKLYEENLEFVRVRIRVEKDVPILIGTTATIKAHSQACQRFCWRGRAKVRRRLRAKPLHVSPKACRKFRPKLAVWGHCYRARPFCWSGLPH